MCIFDRDFTSWSQEWLFFITFIYFFQFFFGLLFPFPLWTSISLFFIWTFIFPFISLFLFFFGLLFSLFFLDFYSIAVTFWISSKFLKLYYLDSMLFWSSFSQILILERVASTETVIGQRSQTMVWSRFSTSIEKRIPSKLFQSP